MRLLKVASETIRPFQTCSINTECSEGTRDGQRHTDRVSPGLRFAPSGLRALLGYTAAISPLDHASRVIEQKSASFPAAIAARTPAIRS
jgi:hypothetical protein